MAELTDLHIYDAPETVGLDIGRLAARLAELMPPVTVHTHSDFFTHHLARFTPAQIEALTAEIAGRLAEREVHDPDLDRDLGRVYDAPLLQQVMAPLIPEEQRTEGHMHVALLTHCLARREEATGGFSLTILQPGNPALVSTSCLVEAPDLPREYLFRRAQLEGFGLDEHVEELEDEFAARLLTHADPRVTLVATGYVLQAVFHHLFGTLGCDCPTCPLYEARSHDELARAHLSVEAGLCERHAALLRERMQ